LREDRLVIKRRQWRKLGPERPIGCIVVPRLRSRQLGIIRHVYGDRFPIGEAFGEKARKAMMLETQCMAETFGLKFRVEVGNRSTSPADAAQAFVNRIVFLSHLL
jgi:hypothetical protein